MKKDAGADAKILKNDNDNDDDGTSWWSREAAAASAARITTHAWIDVCVCVCAVVRVCVCLHTTPRIWNLGPPLALGVGRFLCALRQFCALIHSLCVCVCVCPFPLSPFYRKRCIGSLWGLPTKGPVRVLFVVVAAALFHLCFLSDFFLGFQFVRRFVAPVCSAPCSMPHASCLMPHAKWQMIFPTQNFIDF